MCYLVTQFKFSSSSKLWISISCLGQQSTTPFLPDPLDDFDMTFFFLFAHTYFFDFLPSSPVPPTYYHSNFGTWSTCILLYFCQMHCCLFTLNTCQLKNKCMLFPENKKEVCKCFWNNIVYCKKKVRIILTHFSSIDCSFPLLELISKRWKNFLSFFTSFLSGRPIHQMYERIFSLRLSQGASFSTAEIQWIFCLLFSSMLAHSLFPDALMLSSIWLCFFVLCFSLQPQQHQQGHNNQHLNHPFHISFPICSFFPCSHFPHSFLAVNVPPIPILSTTWSWTFQKQSRLGDISILTSLDLSFYAFKVSPPLFPTTGTCPTQSVGFVGTSWKWPPPGASFIPTSPDSSVFAFQESPLLFLPTGTCLTQSVCLVGISPKIPRTTSRQHNFSRFICFLHLKCLIHSFYPLALVGHNMYDHWIFLVYHLWAFM